VRPTPAPNLRAAAITDIGRVRRQNEDRFVCEETLRLFGVADGIGGLPGGAQAAHTCITTLTRLVEQTQQNGPTLLTSAALGNMVEVTNAQVAQLGATISPSFGIGTTLTAGVIQEGHLLLAHVGDSRCLHISGGDICCLTEDHSVENDARRRRALGELVDVAPRYRTALTRCVGQPSSPEIDLSEHVLNPGDQLVFLTDGVARVISESEIRDILSLLEPISQKLAHLISLVHERGAPDNATAVLVELTVDDPSPNPPSP
jgi:serine/threonine protein phosphatase PrpC